MNQMKQVRRKAEAGDTIVVTHYYSPFFGEKFVVKASYMATVAVFNLTETISHSDYEVIENDLDKVVNDIEVDYHLMALHHAIKRKNHRTAARLEYTLFWLTADKEGVKQ